MKRITHWLALASIATLCLGVGNVMAQDQGGAGGDQGGPGGGRRGGGNRGNFDPAQMQERMMQGVRDRLEVKDDTEWAALQPLVQKVMDLRREQMGRGMRGAFGRGGRGGGNRFGGEASAEETALTDAIEKNASKEDLKAKMAAYRKVRDAKEAELKAAQDKLKAVLTTKQEALALEMSLVN